LHSNKTKTEDENEKENNKPVFKGENLAILCMFLFAFFLAIVACCIWKFYHPNQGTS